MKKYFTLLILLVSLISVHSQLIAPSDIVFPDPRKINEKYTFGSSIAGVEGFLAVGASTANNKGLVYVLQKQGSNWTVIAELTASVGVPGGEFGYQVAMDSNTVVVSMAPSGFAKPVYVFEKPATGWTNMTETAILHASDSTSGDGFGKSIRIQNDHIFVGSPGAKAGTSHQGAVYVFKKLGNNWSNSVENRKIMDPNGIQDDEFGYSIAVQGNLLLVGAPREWTSGLKGRTYVFQTTNTWTQGALSHVELTASNGAYGDRFGHAVDINGNDIVISAPYYDGVQPNSGILYQFSKPSSGWISSTETLVFNSPGTNGTFTRLYGDQIRLENDALFVSAPAEADTKGGVFAFNKLGSVWNTTPDFQMVNGGGDFNDKLGLSIWVNNNELFAGMPGEDFDLTDEGTVKIYQRNDLVWNSNYLETNLNPPDKISYAEEQFGFAVDMEGDLMVVGAPRTDLRGVAYVKEYNGSTWNTLAILRASNAYDDQWFGKLVKIDGDWIGVVSGVEAWDTSIIYLFKKPATGWTDTTETCRISFYNGGSFYNKIQAFDLENGTMVASCTKRKRAFVYEKGTGDWTSNHVPIAGLQEPFSSENGFGYAVKIWNDVIVVTDPYRMINAKSDKGAVLVYEKPSVGWADMVSTAILRYSDLNKSSRMGMSVDIEGDMIVAGAPFFKSPQFNTLAGAGVVFKRTGPNWASGTEVATLNYENIPYYYHLGSSVAIEGGKVYLGADWAITTTTSSREGSFMVFDNHFQPNWVDSYERTIVYGPSSNEHEVFGSNILVQGSRVVLGSQLKDSIGHNSGAVFIYESCYSGSYNDINTCGSYTWVDGVTYTEAPDTILEATIVNSFGCDSIVYLDLTFYSFSAAIADSSGWLTASPNGKQYAWYDCDSDQVLTPFFGASQYFPSHDGSYAVIIMDGNCIDTSDCISYNFSGLEEVSMTNHSLAIYPNPNAGRFIVSTGNLVNIRLYTLDGKEVEIESNQLNQKTEIYVRDFREGLYLLTAIDEKGLLRICKVQIGNN